MANTPANTPAANTPADQGGHSFKNIRATDKSKLQSGDYIASGAQVSGRGHSYDDISASGSAAVHLGNNYGGKSVFDD